MNLTTDIIKQIISEEIKSILSEQTREEQEKNAVQTISGILIRLDQQGTNAQEIMNQAEEAFRNNKDIAKTNESCGDMQSIDMEVEAPLEKSDHEGSMAKRQMFKTAEYAADIFDMIEEGEEFPAWIQSKMTKIADYIGVVKHYLEYDHVMGEKLDKDADAGDYVKDFQKSDAPQFKGKSKKKKQKMAIAAYLDAQEDK